MSNPRKLKTVIDDELPPGGWVVVWDPASSHNRHTGRRCILQWRFDWQTARHWADRLNTKAKNGKFRVLKDRNNE